MTSSFTFALCADDYAMAPGVSRGIREALDAGVLTATSVMASSPHWPQEASDLQPFVGRADIGLHLNLTLGRPLGAMPRFAARGRLPKIGAVVAAARRKHLPLDELADEIDRQLDAFVAGHGRPPDHVDGHQHVHVLAPVRRLLIEALLRRGWAPWIRDSADRPLRILRRGSTLVKAAGIAALAEGLSAGCRRAGLATNNGFAGISSFDGATAYRREFARYLKAPGRLHLVMCHPGYVDEELRSLDPVVDSRERELKFLLSRDFPILLQEKGAVLGRLSDMIA